MDPSPMPEVTSGSGDANALAEMPATIDELHCQNQTLEDNVHNIRQFQEESNPLKEMEVLDP